jgi:hypothetical protein
MHAAAEGHQICQRGSRFERQITRSEPVRTVRTCNMARPQTRRGSVKNAERAPISSRKQDLSALPHRNIVDQLFHTWWMGSF